MECTAFFGTKRSLRKAIPYQSSSRHFARRRLAKPRERSHRREGKNVMVKTTMKLKTEKDMEKDMEMDLEMKLEMEQKLEPGWACEIS
jgi:hypothetical protein